MSASATRTRLVRDPQTRAWVSVPVDRASTAKPWVEPNLRPSSGPARENLSSLFLSASGLASFMLSFVLVLSLALLITG